MHDADAPRAERRAARATPCELWYYSHRGVREWLHADAVARVGRLTPRQQLVLVLLSHGLSRRQIAQRLAVSWHTVSTLLADVSAATGVRGKVRLTRLAIRAGVTSVWVPSLEELVAMGAVTRLAR